MVCFWQVSFRAISLSRAFYQLVINGNFARISALVDLILSVGELSHTNRKLFCLNRSKHEFWPEREISVKRKRISFFLEMNSYESRLLQQPSRATFYSQNKSRQFQSLLYSKSGVSNNENKLYHSTLITAPFK